MFRTIHRSYMKNFLVFLLPFLLLSLAACGESGSSGGAAGEGATASISLSADSEAVPADGKSSVAIEAQLRDSLGQPVFEGTEIRFHTNIGTFRNGAQEYGVDTAGDSGTVIVQLHATEETGPAEVWVESNGIRQKVEVRFLDPDKFLNLSLATGSDAIAADGQSQVAVTATLTGPDGSPVDGLSITFKTTLGSFDDSDTDEGSDDVNLSDKRITAATDVDGEARVLLTSGRSSGEATITAEISGVVATTTVLFLAGEPVSMNVRAMPDTIRPLGNTEIVALVFDINDNPVPDQEVIFTDLINGSGGELEALSAVTNVNGVAQVTYTAGGDAGADIIQASLASDRGMKATTTVLVDPGAIVVGGISLTVGAPSLVAGGSRQVNVRAVVTDVDGNPASGKRVRFSSTAGTLTAASEFTSNTGLAEVQLHSSTKAGPVIVRAECNGFIAEANVEFIPGPATQILLYAFPNVVPPNGEFQTAAIVMDENDNRIDDVRLHLEMRRQGNSQIIDSAEMTPDQAEDGVYRFDWTAASEYYGTGDLEITARINNGVSESVIVRIREGAIIVGSITLTAGSTTLEADGNATTAIRATVLDNNGQPAAGITVNFSTTLGSLSTSQQTTNSNGIAELRLRAGTVEGIARVIADANGWRDQVNIEFVSGFPGSIGLTAMPATVSPGGTSTVTATLTDRTGAPISGEGLHFEIVQNNSGGGLSATTVTTNAVGKAAVTYTAGIFSGTDRIRVVSASNSSVQRTTNVQVQTGSGFIGSINLTADSDSLPADGRSSTAIRAEILDSAGNPVPEGTAVSFNTDLGQFSTNGAMSVTRQTIDDSGTVVVTLISSSQQGVATITASSGSVSQSVNVIFESSGVVEEAEMAIDVSRRVIEATGSSSSEIRVLLRDQNNNPIPDAVVRFSTNLGTITASAVTGADGYAYVNGNQGEFPVLVSARQNGIATIRAWYGPQDVPYASAQTDVRFTGTTLAVSADPDSLSTDEYTVVTASLRGPSGDPLVDQDLLLETDLGVFTPISGGTVENDTRFFATTDSSGNVSVRLSSSSGGTATITAWHVPTIGEAGETAGTKEVVFSGQKLTITSLQDWLVADGTSSMSILLELEDEAGDPIANQVISLSTTLGSVNTSVTTNALGQATATLSAGTVVGNAVLNAVADLPDSTITAQAEVPFISGPVDRIELVSEPSIIKVNTGTSEIRALVRDPQGNPVEGVYVSFTIVSAPGGGETITPSIAQTSGLSSGSPGQASAVFSAGSLPSESIGDVLIEASAGSITASTSLTITSGPGNISLGACTTRDCIVDNGDGSYSIPVVAVLSDINGIAMPAGVEVTFSVNNSELGTIISPAVTNAEGRASTTLTYPETRSGANIQITAATSGIQESVTFQLPYLQTPTYIDDILFLSAPASVPGDGTTRAEFRAQAVDVNGDWALVTSVFFESNELSDFTGEPAGSFVDWTYLGVGEVRADFIGNPGPDENSDPSEFVSNDYDAYVRAYTSTFESDVRQITVKGVTLTIAAQRAALLANGVSTTTVRAILTETSTGMPISGRQLNFGVTNGLVSGAATTDSSGAAEVTFTSIESDVDVTASVRCYSGPDIMASTEIDLVASGDVVNILASADKYTLYNDPGQTATITAQVLDASGNPVDDGQRVTFEVISGPGQVDRNATTTNGMATATFTATPETGTSTVRIASGGQETTIEFEIVETSAGQAIIGSLSLTASSTEIVADGTSNTAIRARVLDIDGNPVSGRTVAFTTSYGTLSSASAATGPTGIAEVVLTSDTRTGVAVVMASISADAFSDQLEVQFVPGPPVNANSSITVQPSSIPADGTSTAEVTVTLADANGNPVLNGTQVELYASRGTITTGNPAPTTSGRATFTIQAPLTTGAAELSLWDYPDIDSAQLGFGSITSGDPASVRIESVSHTEIAVTGVGQNDNTAISVRIADETGSTVVNPDLSLRVELLAKPDGGEFLSGEDPIGNLVSNIDEIEIGAASGEATFNLRSGTLPGVVEIRIEVLESGASLSPEIVTVSPQISIASGPPHSMALSAPTLNAVVDLNTGGDAGIPQTPGFYSRRAGLLVTGRWGNPVPDGTTINLGVIDSVIADSGTGGITDGGSELTDASADFANASITRGGLVREIEPNDRVVLFDVPASDKSRFVTTPIGTTTLPVTRPYENTLTNIEYAVGASLLGASIYGTDGSTATKGTVRTENGLAQLRLVYPANRDRILVGCYPPGVDTRHSPLNSARVISVFTSSDDRVSMVDEGTLCFSPIAGFTLTPLPEEVSGTIGDSFDITLTLVDGGDEVRLPFIEVSAFVVSDGVTVDVTEGATDVNGVFISTVTITGGGPGDSATVSYYAGDARVDVDVSIP